LRGKIAADAYVGGRAMYVTTGIADVRQASSYDVLLDTRA
jgi:hypothetical protein